MITLHNDTEFIKIGLSKEKFPPPKKRFRSFFCIRGVTNGCFIYRGNEFATVKKLIQVPQEPELQDNTKKVYVGGGGLRQILSSP